MKTECLLIALFCHCLPAFGGNPYRLVDDPARRLQLRDRTDRLPYAEEVRAAAAKHRLTPALLHALIAQESAYRNDAVSSAGAQGLMQLMPDTAARFGVRDAHSPRQNIEAGAAYLRLLLDRYDQNLELALAAYNAGEGAVDKHRGEIPPYAETRRYVPAVKARYERVQQAGNPYRLTPAAGPRPQRP